MMQHRIACLAPDPRSAFPRPDSVTHPDGLLAWGGDLHPERLLNAYRQGIFPWYEKPPILWWSPAPRAVLLPGHVHVSRSLRKTLRRSRFKFQMDTDFIGVMQACAEPRTDQSGTWITPEMVEAFTRLHNMGHAHSLEVLEDGKLVGGVYGLSLGKIFFAESKFHRRTDASKAALLALMRALGAWDFLLADCQIWNPHLERMGVRCLDRNQFQAVLSEGVNRTDQTGSWQQRFAELAYTAHTLASAT
jgi:leucyl/phenylalanyl-tRNA--protein transferase